MRNYISPIINAKLPSFLSTDYPQFKKFIQHYFDFLEENGNPLEILENFSERLEVNNEVDLYIDKIIAELGFDLNHPFLIPKKELVHHLRAFYLSRGSQNSFKFLFKVLFNDFVEIEYPRDQLFSLSNATYTGNFYLFTSATTRDTTEFQKIIDSIKELNITLLGVSSHITSSVENIQIVVSKNQYYLKIQIDSNLKKYLPYEGVIITVAHQPNLVLHEYLLNSLDIQIDSSGQGYQIGDLIQSTGCGLNGKAVVHSLSNGKIKDLIIVQPGSGYALGDRVVAQNTTQGHSFSAIVNQIGTLEDPPIGAIRRIRVLSSGYDYNALPDLYILSATGTGASLEAVSDEIGRIKSIEVIEPFVDAIDLSSVSFSITSSHGSNAQLVPVAQTVYSESKSFKNLKGALGVHCVILDSYYFQQFSYILRSSITRSNYDQIVDDLIHPTGFVRFAITNLYDHLDLNSIEEWKYGSEWMRHQFIYLKRVKIMDHDLSFMINPSYNLELWKDNTYSFLNTVSEFDWIQEEDGHNALQYLSPTLEARPIIRHIQIFNPSQVMINPISNLEWFKESLDSVMETNYPVANDIWGEYTLEYIHDSSHLMNRALESEIDQHLSI